MDSPRTKGSSSDAQRQKQAQRQQGASDPATPRSSSGMQMSDEIPKLHEGHNPMNFSLHGRYGDAFDGLASGNLAAPDNLPLSMAHKSRKDDNNNDGGSGSKKSLRPYPVLSGVQAAGSSIGSTPMGSEAAQSDDSQTEGDLHPFEVSSTAMQGQQKQKGKQQQQQQQPRAGTTGHHVSTITAAALPSKVFNGEAWLLDPYGTGNNPLSSSDLRMNKGKSRTLGRNAAKGGSGASEDMLDQYGETDTRHAGRSASLASNGDIELPVQHELVQDRLGSPGSDDLGI
ncbi:hypothetical protein PG995_013570 [Apiospora arundinis]|uniref:Uncharacterized protein n=1 Tax=Apiospora arundinis TaxID=335852 RepID=A0ABR2I2Q9_9PEZI